ncbi:MAG TPA: tRNA (N6-threonylcarbamoyladenosine(37)-N6)-methyltransferase TrmO [Lachnospiraceae bacterium]|nr:tRNA (N6-threonylcarbamoyladenosine(37)-N6)-methyltransferase TrmO [Lachnospiraceae bacterium]
MNELVLKPIAYIRTDFPEKFGIPRQSGLADTVGTIVFEKEYGIREAVRGLEEFSFIWLIWGFSGNRRKSSDKDGSPDWRPTVRPPRLGGNTRAGVFATRSPFRPNPVGLSSVRLEKIEFRPDDGPVLIVRGADLMDGTPIYDIKPYLPYADSHPDAKGGFTDRTIQAPLRIHFPEELRVLLPEEKVSGLMDVLREDPRPSYQDDPGRIYGLSYAGRNIRFRTDGHDLYIIDITSAGN